MATVAASLGELDAAIPTAAPDARLGRRGTSGIRQREAKHWRGAGCSISTATFFVLFAALPFAWMVFTVFKHEQRSLQPAEQPVPLQRSADAGQYHLLFERDQLPDLHPEHRLSSRSWW